MFNIILSLGILYVFACLFVWLDDAVDWFLCKVNKENEKIVLMSVEEMKEQCCCNKWYMAIYRFFNNIKEFPVTAYEEINWFIQRGLKGYSKRDVWSIDYFLNNILPSMLKDLKENIHGYPIGLNEEKWKEIINELIWTFETAKHISEDNWLYQNSKKFSSKKYYDYNRIWDNWGYEEKPRSMTQEECKRFEKGQKLFWKYYFNLWD